MAPKISKSIGGLETNKHKCLPNIVGQESQFCYIYNMYYKNGLISQLQIKHTHTRFWVDISKKLNSEVAICFGSRAC